jgi:biotin transport system substrate-specific component
MALSEGPVDDLGARPAAEPVAAARGLALVAAFAALISACAYLGAIPIGGAGVPVTLQTLGVGLTGCILGPARGFLAVSLYLALGVAGLPVFAEHSAGLGAFTGPSAGYLLSFPLAAAVAGAVAQLIGPQRRARALWMFLCGLCGSAVVVHPAGIVGIKLFFGVPWHTAVTYDLPFWVGDLLKTTVAAIVAAEVHRAFPQLLVRR